MTGPNSRQLTVLNILCCINSLCKSIFLFEGGLSEKLIKLKAQHISQLEQSKKIVGVPRTKLT